MRVGGKRRLQRRHRLWLGFRLRRDIDGNRHRWQRVARRGGGRGRGGGRRRYGGRGRRDGGARGGGGLRARRRRRRRRGGLGRRRLRRDGRGGLRGLRFRGGQMKLVKPLAEKAAALFGLDEQETRMLNEVPHRGAPMPPTDPLLYRFYELVMINGPAWKALIEDEFGDGIMSAIDFDMAISREANPKGDRVRISMSGKFLPYKYYGAEQGLPENGVRED